LNLSSIFKKRKNKNLRGEIMKFKFRGLILSAVFFTVALFLLMLTVQKKVYAANAVSNADSISGSLKIGTSAKIKK
jgi:hypothetical protein